MPRARVVRSCKVHRSARVKQLEGLFDLPKSSTASLSWDVDLPLETRPWSIGLIHGPSGCGKSTIARELFGKSLIGGFEWDPQHAIVDGFPESMGIKEVTQLLSSVGFSSPPAWLRPFALLSNGEQFRVTVARALAESPDLAVIDEFTSVVDRTVARIGSAAIAKAIRARPGTRFVGVACHDDIIDWLQPDWTYQPATGEFQWRSLQRRPEIRLEIQRCPRAAWRLFAGHHYLSGDCSHSAECYLGLVDGRPATFAAIINSVTGYSNKFRREHRVVCLPDFQGVGLGSRMSEAVGSIYRGCGYRYFSVSGHPAIIAHRYKSRYWKVTRKASMKHEASADKNLPTIKRASDRITCSCEYVGPACDRELAERVRNIDLTRWVREFPNRTADRYSALSGATPSQAAAWLKAATARGVLVASGTGRGHDRLTYALTHG